MAVGVQTSIVGLATDPNPLQSGTRGALRRARDVVIDQPGMARCRPVFEHVATKATAAVPRTLVRFDGETFALTLEGSAWTLETETADIATGDDAAPPQPDLAPTSFAEARESLFYTTASGVRKVESAASTESTASGVEFFMAALGAPGQANVGSGGPFSSPASWAYRYVGVKTDSHGAIRRSAPSNPLVGINETAASSGYIIEGPTLIWFYGLEVGDLIEVYRTRMTSSADGAVPPDYYLCKTYTVTADHLANGLRPDDDKLSDDDLGAALYTNPSREGILGSKDTPPIAALLAVFAGAMWFGNTTEKHRLELSLLDVGGSTSPSTTTHYTTTGLLSAYFTGTFTAGSPVVTGVPDVEGIVPGMAVNDTIANGGGTGPTIAGAGIDADTKILSVSGAGPYTITMTKNALGTGAGEAVACDVITINGVEFYACELNGAVPDPTLLAFWAPRCFLIDTSADAGERILWTLSSLIQAINYETIADPSFRVRARVTAEESFVLEEVGIGGAVFGAVCATRPSAWRPDLSAGISSSNTTRPGRLWWSDPDEPEAVPLLQFVDVGSQVDPIIALTPLNAALLIWKRDGLYRLSGVAPDSWRVDVVDPSLRLLRSECVDVMDGVAFAWTNRGVVAVTEGGSVNSISGGLIDRPLLDATRNIVDNTSGTAWLRCHRSRRLVLLAIPTDDSDEAIYCWSSVTEAWSTWSVTTRCAHYSSREERLYYFSDEAPWRLHRDSGAGDDRRGFDRGHLLSGWTATAGSTTVTLTDAEAGEWTPRPGHWLGVAIGDDTHALRILSADFDTVWTLELDTVFPSGSPSARVAYEGITGLLEWQPVSAAGPGVAGLWRELQVHMHGVATELLGSPCRLVMGGRSDLAASVASVANTFTAPQVLSRSYRAGLSRQIGRGHHFYPYIEVNQLQWPWRLSGIGAVYEPVSNKVRR